jgi:branched-chain amino acid transport system permease protein
VSWSLIISNALYAAVGVNAIGYALIASGINVHFGYTGLLNFGQAGFAAIGAYAVAIPVSRYDWPFFAAVPLIFVGGILFALLLGIPTLRLRADYLAIVTIAAAEIVRISLNSVRFTWLTGGNDGLQKFTADVESLNPLSPHKYKFWAQTFSEYDLFIIICGWILVAIACYLVYLLVRSPWGRVLKSIREDEDAARSLGKNVFAYKMQSLVLGGVIGAFGGMFWALSQGSVSANNFNPEPTFFAYVALILGGTARIWGPVIGSMMFWAIITFTNDALRAGIRADYVPDWLMDRTQVGTVRLMLVGLALILLIIFRPQGIFGDKREIALEAR